MDQNIKPKIVCLGAGTGQATVLNGLKEFNCDLTGIVNVTDNGGSSGVLRREMGIPQPGDTRNCLQSVADSQDLMTKIFSYRFEEGFLKGASLGNLILAALTRITGDFGEAVEKANVLLKTEVRVYPVTSKSVDVACELENGKIVRGEWDIILREDRSPIKRMFLTKNVYAHPPCLEVIRRADLIVIGPGSLFTGIIPHFLTRGIKQAILKSSHAKTVYICNMMTQPGQTDGFKVSDHIAQVSRYLGKIPDYVIANQNQISSRILRHYKEFGSVPVELDDMEGTKMIIRSLAQNELGEAVHLDKRSGKKFREWSEWTHLLRHDSKKLARILIDLVNSKFIREKVKSQKVKVKTTRKK